MILDQLKHFFFAVFLFHIPLFSAEFVLFTQPKTGTHLLKPILEELTKKTAYSALGYHNQVEQAWELNKQKNTFLHLHSSYSIEKERFLANQNCIVFFVKRDPRDSIVSLLNHYKRISFVDKSIEMIPNDDDRLLAMIQRKLRNTTLAYMGWLTSPICCVLDFAKLMGEHGGSATNEDALQELRKIANALELDVSDEYLREIYFKHFGKPIGAFFRGKVGSWRDYFTQAHKTAVKQEIGDLLIQLGYERDNKW